MTKSIAKLIVILVLMLLQKTKLSMLSQPKKRLMYYIMLLSGHDNILSTLPIIGM